MCVFLCHTTSFRKKADESLICKPIKFVKWYNILQLKYGQALLSLVIVRSLSFIEDILIEDS